MTPLNNPFVLGQNISRPYFCDRIDEQKALLAAVGNGRNVVLISPRRMGKTSLARIALNDLKEGGADYFTIIVDILSTNSLGEFTYLFGKAIFDALLPMGVARLRKFIAALKSLKGMFGFDPITGNPTFNLQLGDIRNPEYTLDEVFDFIEKSHKPVIVMIDEFQQITKYPEKNVEAILRSRIQLLSNATFIFAGSERSILQEMFASSKRPFYLSADFLHLGPINEDVYVEFAQRLFSEREKQIEEEAIRWTFKLFDGITFYVQRTMNGAFTETPCGQVCTRATVAHAASAILTASEVVYREFLANISASQKAMLYAVAQERCVANPTAGAFIKKYALHSASSVQGALARLMKAGMVVRTEQGYSLTDPMLRIFINSIYSTPEF